MYKKFEELLKTNGCTAYKVSKATGVPEYPFHTFRHTFCTNLCRAEVPIQVASKLMGHKSVEVTAKFYTLVDKDEQKAAINLLK